jgi:hypothetical protein
MATREGATIMKGEIIDNTAVEIDETQLESGEKWTPIDFRPQDRRQSPGIVRVSATGRGQEDWQKS